MNQSNDINKLYAEYVLLTNQLLAIRGGRYRKVGGRNTWDEIYEKAAIIHLELVARGAMAEDPREKLGGKTNSENLQRGTISYPKRKKLGKKKKGGRRRV